MQLVYSQGDMASVAIRVALAERGVSCKLNAVQGGLRFEMADPVHAERNPLVVSPYLIDGDRDVIGASRILAYLDRVGDAMPLIPKSPGKERQALEWMNRFEGATSDRVASGRLDQAVYEGMAKRLRTMPRAAPELTAVYQSAATVVARHQSTKGKAKELLERLDRHIGDEGYLLGDEFTAPDCFAVAWLWGLVHAGKKSWLDERPNVLAYMARLEARSSFDFARVADDSPPRDVSRVMEGSWGRLIATSGVAFLGAAILYFLW